MGPGAARRRGGRCRGYVGGGVRDQSDDVRLITAILDVLAACARIVFEVGLGLVQWANARRRRPEGRRQDDAPK